MAPYLCSIRNLVPREPGFGLILTISNTSRWKRLEEVCVCSSRNNSF